MRAFLTYCYDCAKVNDDHVGANDVSCYGDHEHHLDVD